MTKEKKSNVWLTLATGFITLFSGSATLAYPLPSKPFENQAAAPCRSDLDEVEINGGCWMTLARRPPCLPATQGEYNGKCYLPVSKNRGDKPRSIKP